MTRRRSGSGTQGSTIRSHGKGLLVHGEFVYAELEGTDELLQAIDLICGEAEKVLEEALWEGAEIIRRAADANEPNADIQKDFVDDYGLRGVLTTGSRKTIGIGPSKDKWAYTYLETGTTTHEISPKNKEALVLYPLAMKITKETLTIPGLAAKPFLRPAFDANTQAATKKFGDVVWERFLQITIGR